MAKILIVDDAHFMRMTLSTILQKENYEIIGEASNGIEAIELYKKTKPDLITMDITMPIMDGVEAIKILKEYDTNIKIIVCSALNQQKVVLKAIEEGAKDFITKPFDEHMVLNTIRRVLTE